MLMFYCCGVLSKHSDSRFDSRLISCGFKHRQASYLGWTRDFITSKSHTHVIDHHCQASLQNYSFKAISALLRDYSCNPDQWGSACLPNVWEIT